MMEAVLTDAEFWRRYRANLAPVIVLLFRSAFLYGATLGSQERPNKRKALPDWEWSFEKALEIDYSEMDFDAINSAADRYIANYMDDWWAQFERSTQERMRAAFQLARTNGLQPAEVAKMLEPLFGPARARSIAITEMTRLMGGGAQEQYRLTGYREWEWRTANDRRVDPRCEARDGQTYTMDVLFEPEHPGCRCWPVPAGDI